MSVYKSNQEKIEQILEFTVSQGGHIGFKEVIGYGTKYFDVSIFSDGTMKLTLDDIIYGRDQLKLEDRSVRLLDSILQLISENKFL